ncbi:MAG: ATP-binding protein [Planctomycetales bacterium]|nr:ATP-binding protein [Planctomycetales bacterium]
MTKDGYNIVVDTRIPSDVLAGRTVVEDVLGKLDACDWIADGLFGVRLALEEAVVNAIRHGNGSDVRKFVSVRCTLSSDELSIEVSDEGSGFDPAEVPDCTEDENLEVPSGRGLMLMRSFMSTVEYNARGNRVVMTKLRVSETT